MISLLKAVIGYYKSLGKRGELRYRNTLPAPKPSSLCRVLKYLSSHVLPKSLCTYLSFSNRSYLCLTRVSKDIKWTLGSSPRVTLREESPRVTLREEYQWVTLVGLFFFLFLLFPFSSKAAIYFLPDAQWDGPSNVSIDSSQCELAGYTYYSSGQCPAYHNQDTCVFNDKYLKCDGTAWCLENGYTLSSCPNPKVLNTQCLNGFSLYKYCVCPSTYIYKCSGTGYASGSGVVCDNKYTACVCADNYAWSGGACVCNSEFKYSCSGTGYASGSGTACGGKYKSCKCSSYYSWDGSKCVHSHSYVCPSGYSASNEGMVNPTSTSKVCQLSGCSSTSGTCYKETHVHSYACASGYSTSCSNGYSASSAKTCSHSNCSATSGTCYKCCADTYKYTCSGTGYSSGSGTACSGKYTSCNCSVQYKWNGSACAYCGDSYKYACSVSGNITGGSGTACGSRYTACTCKSPFTWSSGSCVCPSTYKYACTGTGYSGGSGTACNSKYTSCTCATGYHWSGSACVAHSYSCPSGYSASSSGMVTPTSTSKVCSCGATSGTCYKETHSHSYSCPSGYSASSSGMITPTSTSKVCSCGATSGTCYKESHTHSYSCPSGYSASCSNGYSGSASKACSCGATSGTCYACCSADYKYACSGTGYASGSGTACGGKYTSCTCAQWYYWTGSSCAVCPVGSYYAANDTCSPTKTNSAIGVIVKEKTYVMSISIRSTSGVPWGGTSTDHSQIPNITTETKARQDYDGKTYTSILASSQGNAMTWAASDCTKSTWGNRKWYLPAAGELYYVVSQWNSILHAKVCTKCSGNTTCAYPMWSSSEYDKKEAWMGHPGIGGAWRITTDTKTNDKYSTCFLDTSS